MILNNTSHVRNTSGCNFLLIKSSYINQVENHGKPKPELYDFFVLVVKLLDITARQEITPAVKNKAILATMTTMYN